METVVAGVRSAFAPPALVMLPYWLACGASSGRKWRSAGRLSQLLGAALSFGVLAWRQGDASLLRAPTVLALGAAGLVLVLAAVAWRRTGLRPLSGMLAFAVSPLWLPGPLGPVASAAMGSWPHGSQPPLEIVLGLTVCALVCLPLGSRLPWQRPWLLFLSLYAVAVLSGLFSGALRLFFVHWPFPLGG